MRRLHCAIAWFLLGLIAYADFSLPSNYSMAFFYLLPIAYLSWFCEPADVYWISAAAIGAWLAHLHVEGSLRGLGWVGYWNIGAQLGHFGVFILFCLLTMRLSRLRKREHEEAELKSQMLSTVNHEFSNRLMAMRLAMRLLKNEEKEYSMAVHRRHVAMLEACYADLHRAVVNFLNLNRFEAGRFKPEMRPLVVGAALKTAWLSIAPLSRGRDIRLRWNLPSEPVCAMADFDSLMVVFGNLLYNAFLYTPDGGTVVVHVSQTVAPGKVRLGVEDTGIGIARRDFGRIGSSFFRSEAAKRMAKGYGIGLKISQSLLQSQGSKLVFRSAVGGGSLFYFDLPLAAPVEGVSPPARQPQAAARSSP